MPTDLSAASAQELSALYASPDLKWMRANMVLTLDGNYVDENGSSRGLSHPTDLRLLLLLRAMSDVLVVGSRTALGEKYADIRNRPEFVSISTKSPRLCVISLSLNFSTNAKFLQQSENACIVISAQRDAPEWQTRFDALKSICELVVLPAPLTGQRVKQALHERELFQVLCEGGPNTLDLFMQDDSIDEVDITLAPIIAGYARTQLPLGTVHSKWQSHYVGSADNHQFLRYLR